VDSSSSTIHVVAPSISPAETAPSLESLIGAGIASAVCAIARGVTEYQNGGLQQGTKLRGGECVARLYALRQASAGKLDFDRTARWQGAAALRARWGDDVTELEQAMIDKMIGEVLEILEKVVRAQLN
jgi:hypothetical protein